MRLNIADTVGSTDRGRGRRAVQCADELAKWTAIIVVIVPVFLGPFWHSGAPFSTGQAGSQWRARISAVLIRG